MLLLHRQGNVCFGYTSVSCRRVFAEVKINGAHMHRPQLRVVALILSSEHQLPCLIKLPSVELPADSC
jgi:hypothetical protein